jgi:hypothetical protein
MTGRYGWVGLGRVGSAVAVATLALAAAVPARAQGADPGATVADNPFHAAPGNYGTSWGIASYGLKRTYSEFSSPYGGGYGYGYASYGILPGPYGAGLWRPGQGEGATLHGGPNSYRTFAVPYVPGRAVVTPPFGVYAPAFGPTYPGW